MTKRVTSSDVARSSGVSRATVSYVLNGLTDKRIPEETRKRVLAAAKELGYVPSASATALRRGRTDLILVGTSGIPEPSGVSLFLSAFASVVREHGLTVIPHSTRDSPLSLPELARAVNPFIVISLTPLPDDEVEEMHRMGLRYFDGTDFDDTPVRAARLEASSARQVDVLADAGHTRIGFVVPPHTADPMVQVRLRGAKARARERGIDLAVVLTAADDLGDQLRQAHHSGTTAVAAFNDEVAFAVLSAVYSQALRVPRDLAVVGFDDIPLARFATPPLTTVRLHIDTIARVLATDVLRAAGHELDRPNIDGDLMTVVRRQSV